MSEESPCSPHPSVIAAREALKIRRRPTLERIEEQIIEAQAWHQRQGEGRSVESLPATRLPHPDVLAARAALAQQPPASLESVRRQAKASEEWQNRQSDGKGESGL